MELKKSIKNILIILFALILSFSSVVFAADKNKEIKVVASTSWTAAFCDLAGVDNVTAIAPSNLKHPPEYEITVSDVLKVSKSHYFVYAGFERMMETLGNTVNNSSKAPKMIKIQCDNSIDTVKKNAEIISKITGTEKESAKRVKRYTDCIKNGREDVAAQGLAGKSVLCHKHQVFLAEELGFTVAAVFGPGPVTSKQISDAKNSKYDFIIDNIHNPVGQPLAEVAPESKYIIWRNFPDKVESDSLLHVVRDNIKLVF